VLESVLFVDGSEVIMQMYRFGYSWEIVLLHVLDENGNVCVSRNSALKLARKQ